MEVGEGGNEGSHGLVVVVVVPMQRPNWIHPVCPFARFHCSLCLSIP